MENRFRPTIVKSNLSLLLKGTTIKGKFVIVVVMVQPVFFIRPFHLLKKTPAIFLNKPAVQI